MEVLNGLEAEPMRSLRERAQISPAKIVSAGERGKLVRRIRALNDRGVAMAGVGKGLLVLSAAACLLSMAGFGLKRCAESFLNPMLSNLDVPAIAQHHHRPLPRGRYQMVAEANGYIATLMKLGGEECRLEARDCRAIDNAVVYLGAQRDMVTLDSTGATSEPTKSQTDELLYLIANEGRLGFALNPKTMWTLENRVLGQPQSKAAKRAVAEAKPKTPMPWGPILGGTGLAVLLGWSLMTAGAGLVRRAEILGRKVRDALGAA